MFAFFNHTQFRRAIVAFGSLFNGIQIRRQDTSGADVQRLVVPIEYGPKERWLTRLIQDPDFTQSVSHILPRLAYEIKDISYDPQRKINTMNQLRFPSAESQKMARAYVGVPYTLTFELALLTKWQQDAFQVAEQILPYFTPDMTIALQAVPSLNIVDTVPLTLLSTTQTDNYEGDFEHRRAIVWTFNFAMKLFFYGPQRAQSRIEEVDVDLSVAPFSVTLDPPEYFATEALDGLRAESGSLLATEATSNTFLTTGRVARVTAVALPGQDGSVKPVEATVTVTETDGDVKRGPDFVDEPV